MVKNQKSEVISIRGARTHNLKNIDIDIKLNSITCIAGPSGSGKSSLAFHTLLSESKRRFINSLPTDMKFFWEIPHTTMVDSIYPVLPAWGLPQYNPINNSRPSALDVLGGHERVQKIFMELGHFLCPIHKIPFAKISSVEMLIKKIITLKNINADEAVHVFVEKDVYLKNISDEMLPSRSMNKKLREFEATDLWYEILRVKFKNCEDLIRKFKEFSLPKGSIFRFHLKTSDKNFDIKYTTENCCPHKNCNEVGIESKINQVESLSPLNALGACPHCEGHGMLLVYDREKLVRDPTKSIKEGAINFLLFSRFEHLFPTFLRECKIRGFSIDVPFKDLPESIWTFLYEGNGKYEGFNEYFNYLKSLRYKKNIRIYIRSMQREILCVECEGTRISAKAGSLSIINQDEVLTYKHFLSLNFDQSFNVLKTIKKEHKDFLVKEKMLNTLEKLERLYAVAIDLKLGHLKNTRKVRSMSSSEYQRLLLSKYLSYEGSHSLFILDEPSLGLTQKTQEQIIKYLKVLRDQGNTILLVEHSEFLKEMSDEVIEMGPMAGARGGYVISQGKYKIPQLKISKKTLNIIDKKTFIKLTNAKIRDLEKKELLIQKNAINWVFGESGTGKTSFIINLVANEIHKFCFGTRLNYEDYTLKKLEGINDFKNIILINSSLDKISPRSSVASYTDLGGFVRKYFAGLEVSKKLNLKDGHFSSNSDLGQCSSCEGRGVKLVEMHFMEDVEFVCDDCKGKKLKPYYANISDGRLSVYEAFSNPLSEVLPNIKLTPKGKRIWEYFQILKLDYLSLERTLTSLSGGERQRLQLLSLLDKKVEDTFIVFENLTSGLSHHELPALAELLQQLAGSRNTVVVIDQNPFFSHVGDHQIEFRF